MTLLRFKNATRSGVLVWGLVIVITLSAAAGLIMRGKQGVEGLLWGSRSLFSSLVPLDKYALGVNYGVYDPEKGFDDAYMAIEHIYVSWVAFDPIELWDSYRYAKHRDRWLMVTVEPWLENKASDADLLSATVSGYYDENIDAVCRTLGQLGVPLFVRWGHEMEKVTGRYPWAKEDASAYVQAYRRFVDRCRDLVPEALFVWSPAGNKGLDRYWPGPYYVDYIGVSVYGFAERDLDRHGKIRSFRELFAERYARIERFGKPVMIAELGVNGGRSQQEVWMQELFLDLKTFPLLKTVVYFNARDSEGAWESKYAVPNWKIDKRVFYPLPKN